MPNFVELLHVMGRLHKYLQIFLNSISAPNKFLKCYWIEKEIKEKQKRGGRGFSAKTSSPTSLPRPDVPPCRHHRRRRFLRRPDPPCNARRASAPLHRREEKRSPLPSQLRRGSPTAAAEDLDGAEQIGPPLCSPTRIAYLDGSRTLPDPVKHQAATSPCTLAA